jgi:hypothetical protein
MIGISIQTIVNKNLNILHTFGEHPANLENIKDFQSSLGVFGDTYTVSSSIVCPLTRYSAAQTSPHGSEAANLNEVLPRFVYPAS